MDQRVSLITLGVADMEKPVQFYQAIGWVLVETDDGIKVFDLIGQTLGLYPIEALARELGLPVEALGKGGGVLSNIVRKKEDVQPVLDAAAAAGGKIIKNAEDIFWGGHHGHFEDLDGHIWEIAWNPFSELGPNGEFQWNGMG